MIGRSPHAQRRRRWFAATACMLWLLGVEVLPNLHLAFHADDHTHGSDGTIVHADHGADHGHDHDHDHDGAHGHHHRAPAGDHDRAHDHDRDRSGGPSTIDLAASGHTAAGVAHHAIALHRPPPPLLEPLAVPRAAWQIERDPARPLHDAQRTRPHARGPPATA